MLNLSNFIPSALMLSLCLWAACMLDPSLGIALCRILMLCGACAGAGLALALPFIISEHREWLRAGRRSFAGQPWQSAIPSLSRFGAGYHAQRALSGFDSAGRRKRNAAREARREYLMIRDARRAS